jgi:hypothetical protein
MPPFQSHGLRVDYQSVKIEAAADPHPPFADANATFSLREKGTSALFPVERGRTAPIIAAKITNGYIWEGRS